MKLHATLFFAATAMAMAPIRLAGHNVSTDASHQLLAQNVRTKFVNVDNTQIAYRHFGKPSKNPVVFITHFRGSMDVLDPLLVNTIATNREVILVDNTGIGHSEGTVPQSIEAMASTVVRFLSAIHVSKADILGFSMGGMIAQSIAMDYPEVVNKLIIAAARPGYGPGVFQTAPDAGSGPGGDPGSQPTEDYMLGIFFYSSESSKAKGHLWWDRIFERQVAGEERKEFLVGEGVAAQVTAMNNFASDPQLYTRLSNITGPVLVTNGKTDILMGAGNSFVLQQQLSDAELHIYPDSAHGHLFQSPVDYVTQLELFLRC
ncbi:hypothetical protein N0V95_007099 [Ascochyta clinopodiicola]|nr:hypothetical protein N0V95_007099 [Ascochyta clinopodiicola]